jgi:hypothetical protein
VNDDEHYRMDDANDVSAIVVAVMVVTEIDLLPNLVYYHDL